MVMRLATNEVTRLFEAAVPTDENRESLYSRVEELLLRLYDQYQCGACVLEYDVIQVLAPNLDYLKAMFAPDDDFAGVEIETISVEEV